MQQEYDLEQLEEELSQIKNEVVEYDRTYRNKYNNINNEETFMQKNTYSKYVTEVNTETKDLHNRIIILDTEKYLKSEEWNEYQELVSSMYKIPCLYTYTDQYDINVTKIDGKYYTVFSRNNDIIMIFNYGDHTIPYRQEYYFENSKLVYEEAMAQYQKKMPDGYKHIYSLLNHRYILKP